LNSRLMDMKPNVRTFIGCGAPYEEAVAAVFGAPFDSTASFRPGSRFASEAMRTDSCGIETWSPYQEADLEDKHVIDIGDLELPFGNPMQAVSEIEQLVRRLLTDGKKPCMIGGEHLVTFGAVCAAAARYKGLHVIHFDAHADLRDDYMGEKLSHATVMRRVWDVVGDGRVYQFGVRSGCREELSWALSHVYTEMFGCRTIGRAVAGIGSAPVYITLDLDVLDPSEFPGTGTPEAGGVSFSELLAALLEARCLNVVGFDICELSPHCDASGVSTALACKTLREMLLAF